MLEPEDRREWIVEHLGRSLVITRQPIEHFGEPAGSCFNFQEVTYIRQLEQNLSRKLLEKGLTARYTFADVLTQSPKMLQCVDLARRLAGSDFTVLILGESGTGKELLAQSIHRESSRGKQPFVAVNCAAVPENLLESELFGYEGGSFTGALKDGKTGLFEQAHHGTVFLDEIADMPLVLQAKLLRVLQERQIMRIGSQKVINVNIRVIAATNHDLRERIRAGPLPGGSLLPAERPAPGRPPPAGAARGHLPAPGALPGAAPAQGAPSSPPRPGSSCCAILGRATSGS